MKIKQYIVFLSGHMTGRFICIPYRMTGLGSLFLTFALVVGGFCSRHIFVPSHIAVNPQAEFLHLPVPAAVEKPAAVLD